MPLPKGIYSNPEVRRTWIEERELVLAEFDRLVGEGATKRQAARQVGSTPTGIRQMRASLERLQGSEYRLSRRAKTERIDLGLALLSLANPPGLERQKLTATEIAAWCACSPAAIQSIERRALRKLRGKLDRLLGEQIIQGDFAAEVAAPPLLRRSGHPLAAAA